jgi:hypothetical protein
MPIEPPEIPPATPGQPSEPPREDPPGNPHPEAPPPMREPGEAPRPDELPGKTPDEFPARGPNGPSPATADSATISAIVFRIVMAIGACDSLKHADRQSKRTLWTVRLNAQ